MKNVIFMIFLITILWFLVYIPQQITRDNAIDAIVGEASNQNYETMVCVAQGIRHRGTLKRVYGFHARHNYKESSQVWELAGIAWDDSSILKDKIKGARNWGTAADLNWLHVNQARAKCGDIYFY